MILGGLGIQILFIILKLAETIDWSWGWVLFPLWGGLIITVIIFIFAVMLDRD